MLTRADLARFAPRPAKPVKAAIWDTYVDTLVVHGAALCAEFGIDEAAELQHFMAQIGHESGGFTVLFEDMSYSAERIGQIFGPGVHSARIGPDEARQLAHKPEALAERVYGLGNPKKARELGNTAPGDGWRYRGFGPMQTTGKTAHLRLIGPEPTPYAALRAAFREWDERGCNALARAGDLKTITRRINGGYNGLDDRRVMLARAKRVWPVFPAAAVAPPPPAAEPRFEFDPADLPPPATAPAGPPASSPAVTVGDLVRVSRKMRLLESVKLWLGLGSAGAGLTSMADTFGFAQGVSHAVRAVLADHVLLVVMGLCILGVGVAALVQLWILDDHRSGRYVASGSDQNRAAAPGGALVGAQS